MNEQYDAGLASDRVERLIGAVESAIMNTLEAAADRLEAAAEVARIKTRMAAMNEVMALVAGQRQAVLSRLADAAAGERLLCERQLELLAEQEVAVLARVGIDAGAARLALAAVDGDTVTLPKGRVVGSCVRKERKS